MTSTTIEGDVVTGERLIEGIDLNAEVPCDLDVWHHEQGHKEIPPARWRVYWNPRYVCKCPQFILPNALCDACKDQFLTFHGVQCTGCGQTFDVHLAVLRIEPL